MNNPIPATPVPDRPRSEWLQQWLAEGRILLADGATGTTLFGLGLQTGDSPELWNIEHPDRIETLHRGFVEAGSDIILTNSFGGTRYRLALHDAGHRVEELNREAARIARRMAEATDRPVLVAGSMGPTGEILEPSGQVSITDASSAFREQALALKAGGVDILWIETLSSAEEVEAAVTGCAGLGLPIVYTLSIDTNGRTMMGLTAADAVNLSTRLAGLVGSPITAVGTNCGVGASEVVAAVLNLSSAADALAGARPALVAKANCGIPEYVNGKIVYNGTPQLMARYVTMAADAGANIIGGCCGTSAEHIRAMRTTLDSYTPGEVPSVESIVAELGEISTGALAQLSGDLSVAGGSASGRGLRGSRRRRK